ncbi:hypothetical protein TVNIR_2281 [Thioalkalivibrio nitratireducens DSM 14787]|uniref:Uncharacterized protein n=1 Tax=Thioalkalivibrio nitratireducens (strain DSM 14787 / UNIQEM 213 / ALEN2) TaxID=1255043 RepID=L0DY21_THIND|nr:hypothetical protein TVNIR_2281 [Thioalkalivibrio nitratireducens DSM 14787]
MWARIHQTPIASGAETRALLLGLLRHETRQWQGSARSRHSENVHE